MKHLALLMVIVFLLFMSGGLTGPLTSLYVKSLGANYTQIGMLGTVGSLTTLAFSYLWGHFSDRTQKRKRFMMIGLAGSSLRLALTSIVPNFVYLYPLRVLGAIAQSAYGTASLALMGDMLEQRKGRGKSMGTYRGLASLGFGLMAFVAGAIADRTSLRTPFALASALAAVAFLLSFAIKETPTSDSAGIARNSSSDHRPQSSAQSDSGEEDRRRLPMVPLLVAAFLWSVIFGAVYSVWANYMVEQLGYSQATTTRLWSIASTSEFPLMILAGWMSDRVGRLPMLSLGLLAWSLVFVGYVTVPLMPWIVVIQLTRGFAYSAYTATAMTYATEVRSRQARGRASGLYSSAGGMGMILGSMMGGTLTQALGFVPMISICAGLMFFGAVYLGGCALRWRARPVAA
jgi:MFS family permease